MGRNFLDTQYGTIFCANHGGDRFSISKFLGKDKFLIFNIFGENIGLSRSRVATQSSISVQVKIIKQDSI